MADHDDASSSDVGEPFSTTSNRDLPPFQDESELLGDDDPEQEEEEGENLFGDDVERMSSNTPVANVCQFIAADDSDFEESCSSGDEYLPSSDESRDSDVELLSTSAKRPKKAPAKKKSEARRRDRVDSSGSEEDDDIPLARLRDLEAAQVAVAVGSTWWEEAEFLPPDSTFKGNIENPPEDGDIKSPYNYFKTFITNEMIDTVAEQTNIYALQKSGKELAVTKKEIETFLGLFLRMGLVQAHSVRAYWETDKRYPPVADFMSRNRFMAIAAHLHFVNNLDVPDEVKNHDKVWKLRPWLKSLRENFLSVPPEEHNAVDEIMVAFKGRSSIKQYIRGKPKPWGFKLWGRAGSSGMLYDFDVYQGKEAACHLAADDEATTIRNMLGIGGAVVVKLCENLPQNQNYKLFADNFFTSLQLAKELQKKGILFTGTIRANRLKGCNFQDEKSLKAQGRGSSNQKVELDSGVVAVRWFDNKTVDLISTYVGSTSQKQARRWDKKTKEFVHIPLPEVIEEYNKFMGGIDLLDSLTALYKYGMKSRRWYMYIFLHMLQVTVVNAWLWQRRHCSLLQISKPFNLPRFISRLATALIEVRRVPGRPAFDAARPYTPTIKRKAPIAEVRLDNVAHVPEWKERQRCMNKSCTGKKSFVHCMKCKVPLCLNKDRNCFLEFHTK